MSRLTELQEKLHKRKRNRERKRKLGQGHKAQREAKAIRKLRHLIQLVRSPRTMWDAVTISNIPSTAKAVAGYVNGNFKTFPSLKAAFPNARHISIAVTSAVDAHVLDVEAGDATNADAPGWYQRHDKAKYGKAIFYTSASNIAALVATLSAAGIKRKQYIIWSAHYTDSPHVCSPRTCGFPQAEATQFTTHGETVDESKLTWRFWNR